MRHTERESKIVRERVIYSARDPKRAQESERRESVREREREKEK